MMSSYAIFNATSQLKELLNLSSSSPSSAPIAVQIPQLKSSDIKPLSLDTNSIIIENSMVLLQSSAMNDLSPVASNMTHEDIHNLPNNCTFMVPTSSVHSLFMLRISKVQYEGRESTNPNFTKVIRMVDYAWEMVSNVNLIAVHNRKPLLAYTIRVRPSAFQKPNPNASSEPKNNQMIRVTNYETRKRCLAKGTFHHQISDIIFAINSTTEADTDVIKLAIADRGGNLYIYELRDDINDEFTAVKVFEVRGDGVLYTHVRLGWCPWIPMDEDDDDVEGDPGLKLALSCDNDVELFAIDVIQDNLPNDDHVLERPALKCITGAYQIIKNAHDMPILSVSLSNDLTAVCTMGSDDRIKFYQIDLNGAFDTTKLFHDWTPKYIGPDDHVTAFYFLDDFDFLVGNSDQNFWGHAFIGTKNGHMSIVDLKEWQCRQSVMLICDDNVSADFHYRIDFTAHIIIALRNNDAFIVEMKFPHDKEEVDDDADRNDNVKEGFDNLHPYIVKVTRFQIYNAPLRSFAVKKSNDSNFCVFWITGHSLEMCEIDLSQIRIDDICDFSIESSQTKPNISMIQMTNQNDTIDNDNICDSYVDVNTNRVNGMSSGDGSGISPMRMQTSVASKSSPVSESDLSSVFSLKTLQGLQLQEASQFIGQLQRPESPASIEVQQILSPSTAGIIDINDGDGDDEDDDENDNDNDDNGNAHQFSLIEMHNVQTDEIQITESIDDIPFPTKLPNILKDLVREDQIIHLREDIRREIHESQLKMIQSFERYENEFNSKIAMNFEIVNNNSRTHTARLELEMREMKKELKIAYKAKNDEFNRIIDRLIKNLMMEMNKTMSKGLNEFLGQIEKEVKHVTASLEKSVNNLQQKVTALSKTHFEPLSSAPITPSSSTQMPVPQRQQQQTQSPMIFPKTPQQPIATVSHSVPSTPIPTSAARNSMQTLMHGTESQSPFTTVFGMTSQSPAFNMGVNPNIQELLNKQTLERQQHLRNEIMKDIAGGNLENALTHALNLKEPHLVSQICELYNDNPNNLMKHVRHNQATLISLLQQLKYNLNSEEMWKIKFIEQIYTNLDLNHEIVKKVLPPLNASLAAKLEEITKDGGEFAERARVLCFTLKYLKI